MFRDFPESAAIFTMERRMINVTDGWFAENPDRLLTGRELAEIFGVTERTLSKWAARGAAPQRVLINGGAPRYRGRDVARWLDGLEVA